MWTHLARFTALILVWLPFTSLAQTVVLDVQLPADTLEVCAHEPFVLDVAVSGGTGVYSYVWSSGDTSASITIVPQDGDTLFYVWVTDDNGNTGQDSVLVIGYPECVWPGDANGDGTANNLDLLMIGRAYGTQGLMRPDPHFNWIGQPAPSWTHMFNTGVNYAHVDAAGDGHIDAYDIEGIHHNYVLPQQSSGGSNSSLQGVPLYLDIPPINFAPGDTVVASVMLGTSSLPADSIYGIAFSVVYDPALVDSGSVRVDFSDSWLGDTTTEIQGLGRDFADVSQVDIGITRIDQQEQSGYGKVADIIITIDDIAGKNAGLEMLNMQLQRVWLIRKDGSAIDIHAQSGQIVVITTDLDDEELELARYVTTYPNPAQDILTIELAESIQDPGGQIHIYQANGLRVDSIRMSGNRKIDIPVQHLGSGFYIIQIQTRFGYASKRIIIR